MSLAPSPTRPATRRVVAASAGCPLAADASHGSHPKSRLAAEPAATYVTDARLRPVEDDAGSSADLGARLARTVDELRRLLDVPAGRLAELDTNALRDRVELLHQIESLTAAALSFTVGALTKAGGIAEDGASSTTAWVAEATGRTRREASKVTRRSSSLVDLPATAAALADGQIGVACADTIGQAARDGRLGTPEEVERRLLPLAVDGPDLLRTHVRRLTQQVDGAAMLRDERRQHQQRSFSLAPREDGMWTPRGQLTPEVGNKFRTLLDAVQERDPAGTSAEDRRRPDQRMADALEMIVDMALGFGDLPTSGGVSRPHVSVLVDLATFDADLSDPAQPDRPVRPDDPAWSTLTGAETEWTGTLSPQTAVKLCCDAGVSRVVVAGTSQVLDVGRETRNWSPSQRRAVNARDRCCRGPGCGRPIGWTQIHHLRWWERGGTTAVDNGLALCSACHDLIHHRGWHAELDVTTAAVTWTSPDRRRTVVTHPRPPT